MHTSREFLTHAADKESNITALSDSSVLAALTYFDSRICSLRMELKRKTINETESVVKNYSLNSININKIQYNYLRRNGLRHFDQLTCCRLHG